MDNPRQVITCKQTLAISNHRVFPQDLNNFGFMFGGRLLNLLDDVASISVSRFIRMKTVTAAIDQFNFIKSFQKDDAVCIETYVSGAGHRSIEIFAKVMGENLFTGERYLGATAFMTFVLQDHKVVTNELKPETAEEIAVVGSYEQRRATRKQELAANAKIGESLDLSLPWKINHHS
ncbi:Acyl-CoA hydrolase [Agrilactobacillus composti DSM 18527 = JCM 14202]|uniref:Acyl-CoA hydrolase n=2 Tax=Agrilactobacillus TaxID=2767875 RepID=A0A0R1Y4X8_9LACO|nr:acyl-CoA thioesterase [Agrilactobacillus composti]KRM34403.1 Acyl-CoA hydrolase [Agrilactobacillus composti DSM 18527 = JCM 14202]